jgi:hypothetical protein
VPRDAAWQVDVNSKYLGQYFLIGILLQSVREKPERILGKHMKTNQEELGTLLAGNDFLTQVTTIVCGFELPTV